MSFLQFVFSSARETAIVEESKSCTDTLPDDGFHLNHVLLPRLILLSFRGISGHTARRNGKVILCYLNKTGQSNRQKKSY